MGLWFGFTLCRALGVLEGLVLLLDQVLGTVETTHLVG